MPAMCHAARAPCLRFGAGCPAVDGLAQLR